MEDEAATSKSARSSSPCYDFLPSLRPLKSPDAKRALSTTRSRPKSSPGDLGPRIIILYPQIGTEKGFLGGDKDKVLMVSNNLMLSPFLCRVCYTRTPFTWHADRIVERCRILNGKFG
jgi:hypothetical protein